MPADPATEARRQEIRERLNAAQPCEDYAPSDALTGGHAVHEREVDGHYTPAGVTASDGDFLATVHGHLAYGIDADALADLYAAAPADLAFLLALAHQKGTAPAPADVATRLRDLAAYPIPADKRLPGWVWELRELAPRVAELVDQQAAKIATLESEREAHWSDCCVPEDRCGALAKITALEAALLDVNDRFATAEAALERVEALKAEWEACPYMDSDPFTRKSEALGAALTGEGGR